MGQDCTRDASLFNALLVASLGHFRRLCGEPLGAGAERRLLGQRQGLPGELQSGPELQEVYLQDRVESARLIRGGDGVKRGGDAKML